MLLLCNSLVNYLLLSSRYITIPLRPPPLSLFSKQIELLLLPYITCKVGINLLPPMTQFPKKYFRLSFFIRRCRAPPPLFSLHHPQSCGKLGPAHLLARSLASFFSSIFQIMQSRFQGNCCRRVNVGKQRCLINFSIHFYSREYSRVEKNYYNIASLHKRSRKNRIVKEAKLEKRFFFCFVVKK